ncbi:hypothetical protein [Paenibacillus elgii]|uniref:hypothetical protein n=1 Tax=Paenibacillus elgii TaxID=189691 RepID=UPI00203FDAFB|nr:hypothetical protein [Paenibacillus elgii]MCM3273769.1 hypothetical protein [Paenibacillus elgii]GMX64607.1 hypothetical protein Elgi_38760 [Paenibacillus elgii]
MKMKFTKEEVLSIVENHVQSLGFKTGEVGIVYQDKKDYEYFGDPTREDRREIKVRYFEGIEAEVTLSE